MTLIGYMRVSTEDQKHDLQEQALLKAGVLSADIYQDTISGATTTRQEFDKALAHLMAGDTLVVWKLDRLGRGTVHLMSLVEGLVERGVGFRSLTEAWDTSTPMGKAMFRIGCVFAELERETIAARVKAGIAAKMQAGRKTWGKRPAREYSKDEILEAARSGLGQAALVEKFGISRSTVQRVLKKQKEKKYE